MAHKVLAGRRTSTSIAPARPTKPPPLSPGSSLTLTPPPSAPPPPPPASRSCPAARASDPKPVLGSLPPAPAAGAPLAAACGLRRGAPPPACANLGDLGDEGPGDAGAPARGRSAAGSSSAGTRGHCGSGSLLHNGLARPFQSTAWQQGYTSLPMVQRMCNPHSLQQLHAMCP